MTQDVMSPMFESSSLKTIDSNFLMFINFEDFLSMLLSALVVSSAEFLMRKAILLADSVKSYMRVSEEKEYL